MVWVSEGFVPVVTDIQATALTNDPTSAFRGALGAVVAPLVSTALAADPTIAAATIAGATSAVNSQIATKGLIGSAEGAYAGTTTGFSIENADGGRLVRVIDNTVELGISKLVPNGEFVLETLNGGRILETDIINGTVAIPFLNVQSINGATYIPGGSAITRVVLLCGLGQSNTEGRGRPYSGELDPSDTRILMWDFATSTLKTATVPLSSQQQQVGLSILTATAREIVRREPNTAVVIVDAAIGSSGLVVDGAVGKWAIDYAGSNPHLYALTLPILDAAYAAAVAQFAVVPAIRVVWVQGEADGGIGGGVSQSDYATALDALINGLRSHFSLSTLVFVAGGLLLDYIDAHVGVGVIRAAQVDLPKRLTRTAFFDGPRNGGSPPTTQGTGGQSGLGDVHMTAPAIRATAPHVWEAFQRAYSNTGVMPPQAPLTTDGLKARIGGSWVLTFTWSPSPVRVTGYLPQYRINGGAWIPITTTTIETVAVVTGAALTAATDYVEFQVASVNDIGSSVYTFPVPAKGA